MQEERSTFLAKESTIMMWHKRLGNYHQQGIVKMKSKNMAIDLPKFDDYIMTCKACQFGKQNRKSFPQTAWRATCKLQLIHIDIFGPQRTPSIAVQNCWSILEIQKNGGKSKWQPHSNLERDKLEKKELPGVFIGYRNVAKAYKSFQPHNGKIIIRSYVHFVEDEEWNRDEKSDPNTSDLKFKLLTSTTDEDEDWLNEMVDDTPTRGTRLLTDIYARCNIVVCELADFATTMKDTKWVDTMKEVLSMLEKNKTWELVDQPQDRKAIGFRWVYRTKLNVDGLINKHKARFVVKGYAQVFGVDYSDTFAPVARLDTIRLLLGVAAQMNW
ncbi:hypothetical protein V6N11_035650 [Hibiscus sabdariffa]|uniref:Reverse transcriptase Ty1/copia-type domain-containing protein n=1 Tax=Hibiscus sabdariffa TaxID=183260 RepID=A0ABR2NHC6_9ROSI